MGFYPQDSEHFAVNAVIFIGSVELTINGHGHLMYDDFLLCIYSVIIADLLLSSLTGMCTYLHSSPCF